MNLSTSNKQPSSFTYPKVNFANGLAQAALKALNLQSVGSSSNPILLIIWMPSMLTTVKP